MSYRSCEGEDKSVRIGWSGGWAARLEKGRVKGGVGD